MARFKIDKYCKDCSRDRTNRVRCGESGFRDRINRERRGKGGSRASGNRRRMRWICVAMRRRAVRIAALVLTAVLLGGLFCFRPVTAAPTVAKPGIRLPVVMYHAILEEPARQGKYVISPSLFESDLQYLRQQGYTTVTVADLLAYVREGTALPEKPIMLTFDDGYYNFYCYAYPLLREYEMKAVFAPIAYYSEFYSANATEADHPLYSHVTWAQLREMADSGAVEVQNHSYAMHSSTKGERKGASRQSGESAAAYALALRADLQTAQELLTLHTGKTPTAFVYPFGAVSREAKDILKSLGFSATLVCAEKINILSRDPECLFGLGRYLRPSGSTPEAFFARLTGE